MKKILITAFLVSSLSSCYLYEDLPEDQDVWEYESPDVVGLNSEALLVMDSDIKNGSFGNTLALTVVKDDKLIFENYYQNQNREQLQQIGRLGTGIVTAMFGEILNNKLANQLDTPVFRFLPEYADVFNENPIKKEITLEHLLLMTGGLVWNETIIPVDQEESDIANMLKSDDFLRYVLEKQIEAPPGRRFSYNSGYTVILLEIMDKLLDTSIEEYFNERLFKPLDIVDFEVSQLPEGKPNYANGLKINQLDLTKLGYLILKKGDWQGSQLIDSRWIDTMLSSQSEVSNQNDFGFQWWKFNNKSFLFNRYAVDDMYYIFGEQSQAIYLSESRNLLVVVSGIDGTRSFSNSSFFIMNRVLDAAFPQSF